MEGQRGSDVLEGERVGEDDGGGDGGEVVDEEGTGGEAGRAVDGAVGEAGRLDLVAKSAEVCPGESFRYGNLYRRSSWPTSTQTCSGSSFTTCALVT